MKFSPSLQPAILLKRYKRFLADIQLSNGDIKTIHCPNTGAMTACAEPGYQIYYSTSDNAKRKYPNTFELSQNEYGHFIGVNTTTANQIVKHAIKNNTINELNGYDTIHSEVKYGLENSRIDLLLTANNKNDCYIEIKSTTLLLNAETGLGAFPDAVTQRGQKHLRELSHMVDKGYRAVLVYLVQHTGIKKVTVAKHIDAVYAKELKKAVNIGLEIIVLHTHIDATQIEVSHTSQFQWSDQ